MPAPLLGRPNLLAFKPASNCPLIYSRRVLAGRVKSRARHSERQVVSGTARCAQSQNLPVRRQKQVNPSGNVAAVDYKHGIIQLHSHVAPLVVKNLCDSRSLSGGEVTSHPIRLLYKNRWPTIPTTVKTRSGRVFYPINIHKQKPSPRVPASLVHGTWEGGRLL